MTTSNQVILYIATHNKTGLKYFGKTLRYHNQEDLQKYYHGSGVYWKDHLNVHGDDVTMEVYGTYSTNPKDADYVKPIALKLSEEWNIVEELNKSGDRKGKKVWANQKPETGIDGGASSECNKKQKETKGSKEWKETVGRKSIEKYKETVHSKEWLETTGQIKSKNISDTRLSKEWKETVGKKAKRKELETKSSKEWQENVWKPAMEKLRAAKTDSTKYDIVRNNTVIFSGVERKFIVSLSQALMKTTKETPLGNNRCSKLNLNLNRHKKLHLLGMYIRLIKIKV